MRYNPEVTLAEAEGFDKTGPPFLEPLNSKALILVHLAPTEEEQSYDHKNLLESRH